MLMKNQLVEDKRFIKFDRTFGQVFGMYMGTFLFAIILLIVVHEVGHYLAFVWSGYEDASLRITPFFGSTSTQKFVQPEDYVLIALARTIFNLMVASLAAITLRFTKSPYAIAI